MSYEAKRLLWFVGLVLGFVALIASCIWAPAIPAAGFACLILYMLIRVAWGIAGDKAAGL